MSLADWMKQHGGTLEFIKPMQNGFIELQLQLPESGARHVMSFQDLREVREQTEKWLKEYNEERPHESLGD
jgi:putative transposase